jgi:hypothetical protein
MIYETVQAQMFDLVKSLDYSLSKEDFEYALGRRMQTSGYLDEDRVKAHELAMKCYEVVGGHFDGNGYSIGQQDFEYIDDVV